MKTNLCKNILLLTVFAMLGTIATRQPTNAAILYTVTDLGPGVAFDINENSEVVGDAGGPNGFFWDSTNGRQNKNFWLYSINDNGEAVGHSDIGVFWDSNTNQTIDMGQIDGDEVIPKAINNNGQVTGEKYGSQNLYIWDKINGFIIVGSARQGKDINDHGELVGHGSGSNQIAWLWDVSSGFRPLGVLNDGDSSAANAINNLSQVVGNSEFSSSSEQHHAFLWDEVNGMQDLGTLGYRPPLEDSSVALDINIHGQVVGGSNASSSSAGVGGWLGFIYDSTHGMRDLNLLIPVESGWTLGRAWAINDQGQIVGEGKIEGEEAIHAILLTPLPSPIPQIVVSPISYNFEKVIVDQSSDPIDIAMYNYGDVDLLVSDMSLSDDINFYLDGNATPTIEPGGSHVVTVTFSPQSMGEHSATLNITSNAPLKPNVNVRLTGEGEAALWGCVNYKGSPIVGFEVSLLEKGGKNQTAITDSDGCYRFERIRDKGGTMKVGFPAISQ